MWRIGEIVILKWDDTINNQEIIGHKLIVSKPPEATDTLQWMEVEHDGKIYSVRGIDCIGVLDSTQRAAEKAASRAQDEEDIRTGKRTKEQVAKDNGAFAFPMSRIKRYHSKV
jgi:hypothetical protein